MCVRPACWFMYGVGLTLLTSAWGGNQVTLGLQNQNSDETVANVPLDVNSQHRVEKLKLLADRPLWAPPKLNPFAKAAHAEKIAIEPVANTANKQSMSQPFSFAYLFVGRLRADEKDAVFLSKDNRILTVAVGDVLENIYRIEKFDATAIVVTYLPEQRKVVIPFDSLGEKSPAKPSTMLSQMDVPLASTTQASPMVVTGENNVQMSEDMKPILHPSPPPEGDAFKMMGASQPLPGDEMQVTPPVQDGLTLPSSSVPAMPQSERQ
ncbi:MAG: hypothetical protein PHU06_05315 [Gallionella sp.]|nr:hypothetical protein [Gallionella sp.]MDD4959719.1 hypothetical protein [Gallionella sp.]